MIAFLNGILRDKNIDSITVECFGVGYHIFITNSCMVSLPNLNEEVKIYTYMHVREDEMTLYGFSSQEEKRLFLQLISVSGVGSKTALMILSAHQMSIIINSIVSEDTSVLSSVKGLGKKTAERVILELKDKLKPLEYIKPTEMATNMAKNSKELEDAVIVLTSLGMGRTQAMNIARQVSEENDTAEKIVAKALHNMGE